MTKWTEDDIEQARKFVALENQSKTKEEFQDACNAIANSHAETLLSTLKTSVEDDYQELLAAAGGDADVLARKLYAHILGTGVTEQRTANDKEPVTKTSGRPPNKWGKDSMGKLVLYFCIEDKLQAMRAEGNPRPKIKDAVANVLNIPDQRRERPSNKAKISDYASRYSEVKGILKARM
jgi:hypothetical protein